MRVPVKPALLVICGALGLHVAALRAQTLAEAERLWRAHEYQGAVKAFDALIAAHPKDANYRVRYGQFFMERFDPEEAAKLFSEAIEIDPKNARAHLGLATVLADQFSGKANESADKALEIDPKLEEAQDLIARIALEDDDAKKAAEEAEAALAMDATEVQAIAISRPSTADGQRNHVDREIPTSARGFETVGHFFVINRRYEGIDYRKAIAADPELWTAHSEFGMNLMRLGQNEEAYKQLELVYNNYHTRMRPPAIP